jgi:hypothetical protein
MKREKLKFDIDIAKFTPRQMEAVRALNSGEIKFLLYGGALGGGKGHNMQPRRNTSKDNSDKAEADLTCLASNFP